MTPKRIQLRRTKGWRMPPGAVKVDRPTKWGNPFRVGDLISPDHPEWGVVATRFANWKDWPPDVGWEDFVVRDASHAIEMFRVWARVKVVGGWSFDLLVSNNLRGHDLACWCPLEDADGNSVPCHADVLLELANPTTEGANE